MNATGLLVILIGMFILINSVNIAGVVTGTKQFNFAKPKSTSSTSSTNG